MRKRIKIKDSGIDYETALRLVQRALADTYHIHGHRHERIKSTDLLPYMNPRDWDRGEAFTDGSPPEISPVRIYDGEIECEPTVIGVERARTWFVKEVEKGGASKGRFWYAERAKALGCPKRTFIEQIWKAVLPEDHPWRKDGRPLKTREKTRD